MPYGTQPFSIWWTKIKEQAAKCIFEAYNTDKAAPNALLFQTSNVKLRKKIHAKDISLEETIKLGLDYEQTDVNPDQLDGGKGKGDNLRRVVQEEVKRFNIGTSATNKEAKIQCTTCTQKHPPGLTAHKSGPKDALIVNSQATS